MQGASLGAASQGALSDLPVACGQSSASAHPARNRRDVTYRFASAMANAILALLYHYLHLDWTIYQETLPVAVLDHYIDKETPYK
jgi:hypothetical protein